MAKISKRVVDAAEPEDKLYSIWDDELKGFGLRVTPAGAKSFVVLYRNIHGRQRWMTIGRVGVFTPDEARAEARQVLAAAKRGEDPADQRRQKRNAPTVSDLLDRYVAEHVVPNNRESTRIEIERLLKNHIRPGLGRLIVPDVTRSDIQRFHQSMKDRPRAANFARAILSKAFNLAEEWGIRTGGSNPCRHVAKYPERKRDRFLNSDELGRLGRILIETEARNLEPLAVTYGIKLLALTGCRLSEILNLRWDQIDHENGELVFEETKTGARSHIIGAAALAFLNTIPRREGVPWVLPHPSSSDRPLQKSMMEKSWRKIREKAELNDVRLHDLRHTAGTIAARLGASAFLIRDKLGHSDVRTTDRYVNRDTEPLRQLSDQLEGEIWVGLFGTKRDQ